MNSVLLTTVAVNNAPNEGAPGVWFGLTMLWLCLGLFVESKLMPSGWMYKGKNLELFFTVLGIGVVLLIPVALWITP